MTTERPSRRATRAESCARSSSSAGATGRSARFSALAAEIAPAFAADGRPVEIGAWIDGAMPQREFPCRPVDHAGGAHNPLRRAAPDRPVPEGGLIVVWPKSLARTRRALA